jgi:hypothetical protein
MPRLRFPSIETMSAMRSSPRTAGEENMTVSEPRRSTLELRLEPELGLEPGFET